MKFISSIILVCIYTLQSFSQVENRKPFSAFDAPEFYVDAISFAYGDSSASRIDLYIQVPYAQLQFVKEQSQFVAKYDVQVNIIGGDKASITEKLWTEELRLTAFEQTQAKTAYNLTQRSIVITPGKYLLRTQIRDLESKRTSVVTRSLTVDDYSGTQLSLSDLMLVNRVTHEGERRNIVPNVSGNIGENFNNFYVFFEIYHTSPDESLQVHYIVHDTKEHILFNQVQQYLPKGTKTQLITKFDSTNYTAGAYTLTVEVKKFPVNDNTPAITKQKKFSVHWAGAPLNVTDLDLAVKQVRYIATTKDFEAMDEAPTEEEKRRLFEEFWKKRDPSPDTKRNEDMEEYYSRVEYANKYFSHYLPGWKTDMGMVFILFGSPNNVERHPFDIDAKPYEVWSYYDYNRTLLFIDESGFGDYRLSSSIADMIQRLKLK